MRALHEIDSGIGELDALTTGQARVQVGNFYLDLGRFDDARLHLSKGRELLRTVGEQQEKGLDALRALGVIDYSSGEVERAIEQLTSAREGFIKVFGSTSPDAQGASYWLAAALADTGRIEEADELIANLQPDALRTSLGGKGWAVRLDALRAKVLIRQGRTEEGQTLLTASIPQLERDGVPSWLIDSLKTLAQE